MADLYQVLKQLLQQSQFQQAISQADLALEQSPEDLELLYMKAVAHRFLQQADLAITSLNRLLSIDPVHGRAHQEAGYCHIVRGEHNTAFQAFRYAVIANPALLSAWKQLQKLKAYADDQEFAQQVEQQITILEDMPKPLLAAMDLMHEGKFAAAENLCRQFLQQDKHHAQAMCLLAEIGTQTKVYDDASFLLESCTELHPNYQPAKRQWLELLNTLGQYHKALPLALNYTQSYPEDTQAKSTLAACQVGVGDIAEGIASYRQVLEKEPHRTGLHLQLGHALKSHGQLTAAIDSYRQAYALKPGYGDAYWSLANIKTYQFTEQEIQQMQNFANNSLGAHQDRIHFCFALAKAMEDQQNFQQAFHYYQLGNQLKSTSTNYNADQHQHLVDLQIKHCTPELYGQGKTGNPAADPIFILGLPRAGSTLLEQILASHAQIDGTMELHNILSMAMKLRGRISNVEPAYPANLSQLSKQQLSQLGDKFIQETQCYRQGAPLFIDKMPNNFMHIGLIKLILPNAKIIDARREPMACCFSGFKQLFGEGQEFSYNLTDMARYYRDYERLMQHWEQLFPGQILRVQHEELVDNLEHEVRRILDYCGLPFDKACLAFYNNKRAVKTPSSEQVRQPIYRSGMQHWKNFEPWLSELSDALAKYQCS